MKTFLIAELEQYSLIKMHTIRIWEKRYDILKAQRTTSKHRYYTFDQLLFLLDLSLLNRFGHKISTLASLNKHTIKEKLHDLSSETAKKQHQINQLIACMLSLNIEDFELILDSAVHSWGIEHTIEDILLPFLERLKFFSYENRTSVEYHFVVTAMRKKLILAIEQAANKKTLATSVLLFLPYGEHFDLLLLYLNYQLKKAGLNVLYLGTNISIYQLQEIVRIKQPAFVISYVSPHDKKNIHSLSHYALGYKGASIHIITTGMLQKEYNLPFWKVTFIKYDEATREVLRLSSLLEGAIKSRSGSHMRV